MNRRASQLPLLVLEDSDEDFDTVLEVAEKSGIVNPIQRANTGDDCLHLLLEDVERDAPLPAVLLLDLNTPGMDGRGALAAIRARPALCRLPVVVLSTSSNPVDIAYCYAQGANAYHVKPVRYGDHLRVLEQIMTYWLRTVTLPDAEPERQ
ncbi:MAG: rcp [Polyangiaceae bacterium]|jgi:CheY-like chemotaxis protein|nr:rcp [Polyangiaceae bacterium]